jgi:hypothetical protein
MIKMVMIIIATTGVERPLEGLHSKSGWQMNLKQQFVSRQSASTMQVFKDYIEGDIASI